MAFKRVAASGGGVNASGAQTTLLRAKESIRCLGLSNRVDLCINLEICT
jgi:hypothetical protein